MTAQQLPFTPSFFRNDVGGYDIRTGTGYLVGRTAHIFGDEYAAYVAVDGDEREVRLGTYEGEAAAQDALFDHVASGRPAPEPNVSLYAKGVRVYHERYGFGTIVKPIASRKPVRASVRWEETRYVTLVPLTQIEVMSA